VWAGTVSDPAVVTSFVVWNFKLFLIIIIIIIIIIASPFQE
jgi:hypothetical protein